MLVRTTCGLAVKILILHQNTNWLTSAVRMLFLILTPFRLSLKVYFSFAANSNMLKLYFEISLQWDQEEFETGTFRAEAKSREGLEEELYAQWGKGKRATERHTRLQLLEEIISVLS